jgi:hypothetical protein
MNSTDTQVLPLLVFPREVYESNKGWAQFAIPPQSGWIQMIYFLNGFVSSLTSLILLQMIANFRYSHSQIMDAVYNH